MTTAENRQIEMYGGCQCGAVRYHARLNLASAHICHCRMCQKAVGNFFEPFVDAGAETVAWTRGKPQTFASSDGVERGFCARCGTPLYIRDADAAHTTFTIGSLDHPEQVEPLRQYGLESAMPWFARLAGLQGTTTENDDPPLAAAIKATNHQHPDHDTETWPAQE